MVEAFLFEEGEGVFEDGEFFFEGIHGGLEGFFGFWLVPEGGFTDGADFGEVGGRFVRGPEVVAAVAFEEVGFAGGIFGGHGWFL